MAVSGNVITKTVTKPAAGNTQGFTFPDITFKAPGTYTFTMAEAVPATTASHLLYAANTVTVTYTVTMTNGVLSVADPVYSDPASFVNAYTDNETVTFSVKKTLVGGTLDAYPFTFTLTQVAGNNSTAQASTDVKLASAETITLNQNTAEQTASFAASIEFDQDDTDKEFWFLITENAPSGIGSDNVSGDILYDAVRQQWIKVKVTLENEELMVTKYQADETTVISAAPDASFTNTVLTGIYAKKEWTQNGTAMNEWPADKAVTFQLQLADGTPVTVDALGGTISNVTVNDYSTVSFTNLPNDKTYRIAEIAVDGTPIDPVKAAEGTGYGTAANPLVISNPLDTTTVTVTKAWSSSLGTEAPTGVSIVLGLFKLTDLNTPVSTITLDGTADENGESASWTAAWTNLPVYDDTANGAVITYVVKETTGADGYTVSYDNGEYAYALDRGTITNTLNETSIKVVKVKAGADPEPLAGAQFTLYQVSTEAGTNTETLYTFGTGYQNPLTTGSTGEITFPNLIDGTYKLVETQPPAGYTMLSQAIQFTVKDGAVFSENTNTIAAASYTAAAGAEPAAFTVINTPGVALPATGGPGTVLYTAGGLTMMLLAALWLLLRRRREQRT